MARPADRGKRTGKGTSAETAYERVEGIESAAPLLLQFAKVNKALSDDLRLFGTPKDTAEFRERVKSTIATGRDLFSRASGVLLRSRPSGGKGGRIDPTVDRLSTELASANDTFEGLVRKCDTSARTVGPPVKASGGNGSLHPLGGPDSDDEAEEEVRRMEETRMKFRQEIAGVAGFGEVEMSILMEKNEEAQVIVREAVELHGMFRDFNVLVAEQSEGIETVVKQVEEAKMAVKEGNKQLDEAGDYQVKIRRKRCCIILILLAIAAAVIIPVVIVLLKK